MRFHTLKLRGISEAFRNEVTVNFDALGPGLIAVIGVNGAGKSTLIGSLSAALFRQLPAQKRPLYDFATHPEPEIDVVFSVNGQQYRSLLKINPQARQMESYLFQADGTPLSDGKKESFQNGIQRLVGSRALYEASIFSNQKRAGNFLSLERAERKELFVSQLLGLDRLRRLSAIAKAEGERNAREAGGLESEKRGLLSVLDERTPADLEGLDLSFEETRLALEKAESDRAEATDQLGKLQRELGAVTSVEATRSGVIRRRDAMAVEITAMKRAIGDDERILARSAGSNETREKLRATVEKIEGLHVELGKAQSLEARNREVEISLRTVAAELTSKRSELERARVECEELAQVPCQGRGEFADCPKIQRAIRSRQELPQVEGTIATLELEHDVHASSLIPVATSSAYLLEQTREAENRRQQLEATVRQQDELKAVEARRSERLETLGRLERQQASIDGELQRLDEEIARYADRRQAESALRLRLKEVESELRGLRARREKLLTAKAQAEQALAEAARNEERLRTLEQSLASARRERVDWEYLARVFGADEIQLLEIQSAGPELSEIVNNLLEGCLDNKFEVRFRTQRPKADGRGFVDDFDVDVRHKVLDRSFSVEELSGGQFVLVNEALNLGIAMYNARKGEGSRYETLFRDETIGALDSRNGVEYVRMLRRAMEIGGFHQVVFITHTAGVWELADRVIEVKDGEVKVAEFGEERAAQ